MGVFCCAEATTVTASVMNAAKKNRIKNIAPTRERVVLLTWQISAAKTWADARQKNVSKGDHFKEEC